MTFNPSPILAAFSWGSVTCAIIGCVIAFIALLMIITIVFLQDSKEGGLGGAFGSAGGSDALLGAGGQKGIVKVTAGLSIAFAILVILWGMYDMSDMGIGAGGDHGDLDDALKPPPAAGAGAEARPGLSPGPSGNTGTDGSSGGSGN